MQTTHVAEVDLNLLVALQRLFETGSVTAAARSMRLTQSAMSRVLGRLRATFGDPLFVRTASGLAPTPRAEALKPLLVDALARVDAVIAGPSRFDSRTSTRQFTIATADYGLAVVMPLLEVVRREAPSVSLHFVVKAGDWERALANGEWDLCWAPRRQEAGSAAIIWNRLFSEEFTFVVRRGHPAARSRLTLERFLQLEHVAIAPEGKPGNRVDDTLARMGRRRRVVVTVPNFLVVPPLVSASDLGAVLPRRVAASTDLVALDLPFTLTGFEISQAWHERMRHDEGHAWLRQRLRALASTL